jgi:hypothetical protein
MSLLLKSCFLCFGVSPPASFSHKVSTGDLQMEHGLFLSAFLQRIAIAQHHFREEPFS